MEIIKNTHIALMAALLGAGASGLSAQEGSLYSCLLKIRVGLTAGDLQKTHFDNKAMGFAIEAKRSAQDLFDGRLKGAFTGEVAWEYVPGRHHDVYPWDTNPLGLDIRNSFDNRKEYGFGFNVRLGYSAPMPQVFGDYVNEFAKNLEWFAGVGIDRFRVRSEVKYFLNFTPSTQNPEPGTYDSGIYTAEETALVPGVYGGLRYTLNKDLGFELSLRNFGMSHHKFTPVGYYSNNPADWGTGGRTDNGTSRGWALEFAITAKL
ncbi:MAG: hypothetical protein FWG12_01255 [Holophagaceae bacterium]|nr:hypothetical protein [Holophagaceae bacterium]